MNLSRSTFCFINFFVQREIPTITQDCRIAWLMNIDLITFSIRHRIKEGPRGPDIVTTADKGHVVAGLDTDDRHQLHIYAGQLVILLQSLRRF